MRQRREQMSQFARIAWIIVAGFIALELIAHLVLMHDQTLAGARAYAVSVVDRALALDKLLVHASGEEQKRLIAAASGRDFQAAIRTAPPAMPAATWRHSDEIATDIAAHLQQVEAPGVRVAFSAEPALTVVVPRASGDYLVVRAGGLGLAAQTRPAFVGILTTVLVVGLVLWGTRRSTRHLPRFAEAAEALGRNVAAPALRETGPREVRRAAAAFNEMARRIRAYLDERTQMVAAVSHDMRTQLTRLSLRMEYVVDPTQRERAREDVAQMTRLLDSVLAFAREDRAEEPSVKIDLATLLATLADDERALGHRADYRGPVHSVVQGRPTALRRAFTNLIDNAVRYGGEAEVALSVEGTRVVVEIADRGPGIPAADRDRVLQPFQRMEQSRNRSTGGTGLGLAIAHTVVLRHGGSLLFVERSGGGLVVRVELDSRVGIR
jgi:signal transduction histidine kinase